jgi:phosphopantothenoylcysteine decarboxylase/phosphopantothenate--cysteine ligase
MCLKGIGATAPASVSRVEVLPFSTNDDLVWKLSAYAGKVDALFHTAALCDYRVRSIETPEGAEVPAMGKVPTRMGELVLRLEPTTKVLPQLRGLFPQGRLVGWKYEADGTREDVLAKAERQLNECKTDACVVNGSGWGEGFGFIIAGAPPVLIPDKVALCEFLTKWLEQSPFAVAQ